MECELKIWDFGWCEWEIRVLNPKFSMYTYNKEDAYTMIIHGKKTYAKKGNAVRFAKHYAKKLGLRLTK